MATTVRAQERRLEDLREQDKLATGARFERYDATRDRVDVRHVC